MCERWGAVAKAQSLRTTYAEVIATARLSNFARDTSAPGDFGHHSETSAETLFSSDLQTVVHASQAVTGEVFSLPPLSSLIHSSFIFLFFILITTSHE